MLSPVIIATLRVTCLLEQFERLRLLGEDDDDDVIEINVVNVECETRMVNVAADD